MDLLKNVSVIVRGQDRSNNNATNDAKLNFLKAIFIKLQIVCTLPSLGIIQHC